MRITVTQEDWDKAENDMKNNKWRGECCVLGQAIVRQLAPKSVHVTDTWIRIDGDTYIGSRAAKRLVRKFDNLVPTVWKYPNPRTKMPDFPITIEIKPKL